MIESEQVLKDITAAKVNKKKNSMEDEQFVTFKIKPQRDIPVLTQESRERLKLYFKIMIENLQAIRSHNANDYISRMIECMAEIKDSLDKLGLAPKEFFATLHDSRLTAKVRNKAFEVMRKILTMRSEYKIKLNKLDQLLLAAFQMSLVSPKQRDSILECYRDLYKRIRHPLNHIFVETLRRSCHDQENEDCVPSISDLQLLNQKEFGGPNPVPVTHGMFEEAKGQDKTHDNVDVHCIICMKDLKKVVFLPCCHFLTCPGCSKKVSKCPMCNRMIDKCQKIYWS